jgi:hypothetical protein
MEVRVLSRAQKTERPALRQVFLRCARRSHVFAVAKTASRGRGNSFATANELSVTTKSPSLPNPSPRVRCREKEVPMSDRNMIGILLIFGGLVLIFVPSKEMAVQISAYVQQVTGVGTLAAAFLVVGAVCVMILLGGVILMWGRR